MAETIKVPPQRLEEGYRNEGFFIAPAALVNLLLGRPSVPTRSYAVWFRLRKPMNILIIGIRKDTEIRIQSGKFYIPTTLIRWKGDKEIVPYYVEGRDERIARFAAE